MKTNKQRQISSKSEREEKRIQREQIRRADKEESLNLCDRATFQLARLVLERMQRIPIGLAMSSERDARFAARRLM